MFKFVSGSSPKNHWSWTKCSWTKQFGSGIGYLYIYSSYGRLLSIYNSYHNVSVTHVIVIPLSKTIFLNSNLLQLQKVRERSYFSINCNNEHMDIHVERKPIQVHFPHGKFLYCKH